MTGAVDGQTEPVPASLAKPTSVWRDHDFVLYWAGQSASQLGTRVTEFALPLVALYQLSASPAEVGVLRAVEFLPYLLLAIPVGLLADRRRRRPMMILADAGRTILLLWIVIAGAIGLLSIPQLLVAALLVGALTVVFDISYLAALPSMISRETLQQGNTALESSRAFATIAGPSLGGLLISAIRASGALVVDAASFVVSAVTLSLLRRSEPPIPPAPPRAIRAELAAGWHQVTRSPLLRPMTVFLTVGAFSQAAFVPALVVFQVDGLRLSPLVIGLVAAIGNVGFLIGALFSRRVGRRLGMGPAICAGAVIWPLGMIVTGLAPGRAPVVLLAAGQVLWGVGVGLFNLQSVSLRQAVTPATLLGRVNSVARFVGWAGVPVGALLGGWASGLAAPGGPRTVLLAAGVATGCAAAVLAFGAVRRIRVMPDPEPEWRERAANSG